MTCETEYQVSTITTSQFEFTNTVSQMKYRTNEPGISRSLQSLLIASTIQSVELTADVFVSILQKSTCYQRASQDFFFFFFYSRSSLIARRRLTLNPGSIHISSNQNTAGAEADADISPSSQVISSSMIVCRRLGLKYFFQLQNDFLLFPLCKKKARVGKRLHRKQP